MNLELAIIVAIDDKRGIGRDEKLLWYIPEDLRHFKKITSGFPVIMGSKTFKSIFDRIGKPLPNRTNIVLTRNTLYKYPNGVIACGSLEEALKVAAKHSKDRVFVIGGGQVYEQAFPIADRLFITLVPGNFNATVFFPDYSTFKTVISEEKKLTEGGEQLKFLELTR